MNKPGAYKTLLSLIIAAVSAPAFSENIIRTTAPVSYVMPSELENWVLADPLYGDWINNGAIYACGNWTPLTETVTISVSFTQSATDCSQDQRRTVQAREQEKNKGIYRNTGPESEELRTVSAGMSRGAIGTKETWLASEPIYSSWVSVGELYDCLAWTPGTDTVPDGQNFTQTTNDCKQDQTRTRQDREQESTTLAYRNAGAIETENNTLQSQPSSRDAIGTGSSIGSYSHYRVFIEAANNTTYSQIVEMELIGNVGVDLFDQYTVTPSESSYYTSSYKADQAIDNNEDDKKWTSAGNKAANSWVAFKFPVAVSARSLTITNYKSTTQSNRQPRDFRLEVSNDGTTWTTIKRFTGETNWLASEKRTYGLE